MIPQRYIEEWRAVAPWTTDAQVEQDFLANMNEKMTDREFLEDIRLVLKRGIEYDNEVAWELVRKELVEKI
jgi:hypothetical protein